MHTPRFLARIRSLQSQLGAEGRQGICGGPQRRRSTRRWYAHHQDDLRGVLGNRSATYHVEYTVQPRHHINTDVTTTLCLQPCLFYHRSSPQPRLHINEVPRQDTHRTLPVPHSHHWLYTHADVKAISTSYGSNLALKADGTVWGSGSNTEGSLGDGTNVNKESFVKATGLESK